MSFPQIYQNADMLTPASEQGTGVQASPDDTPGDFNDMLDPNEKGQRPRKMSAVRKAGLRKTAQAQGLPEYIIEEILDEMEKEAISWGLAAKAVGSRLLGGLGKGPGMMARLKSVPKVLGRAYRSKVKPAVTTASTRGLAVPRKAGTTGTTLTPLSPTRNAATQMPSAWQGARHAKPPAAPVTPAGTAGAAAGGAKSPASVDPQEFRRMQNVQAGTHKEDPIFKSLLAKEQTGLEKFMGGWGGTIVRDIAPWVVLPAASELLGLGGAGQLAAFGGAMAMPMLLGGRFKGGLNRATQQYLRGAGMPKAAPAPA